jgi:hypothetical protein
MTSNSKNQADKPSGFCNADISTPDSEDKQPYIIPGSMKPIDIESLPLEQQAILRVLARESEKAGKGGEADNAEFTITPEQFDAEVKKLRNEKRKPKR